LNFKALISSINEVHGKAQSKSVLAINQHLTLRNWAIGYYIIGFEQYCVDRQKYGSKLLQKIADQALKKNIKDLSQTYLKTCKQVYYLYPQFAEAVEVYFSNSNNEENCLANTKKSKVAISQRPLTNSENDYHKDANLLLNSVSYVNNTKFTNLDNFQFKIQNSIDSYRYQN
jgi:DUF1016 N-terminal domain